ncbi:hypothetical protein D3C72_2143540 [compost metagenome]
MHHARGDMDLPGGIVPVQRRTIVIQLEEAALGVHRGRFEEVEQVIGLPHQVLPVERPVRPGARIGLGQRQLGVGHNGSRPGKISAPACRVEL